MPPTAPLRLATPLTRMILGRHNGPGLRVVFHVQGCRRPCTERCLNPELQDPTGGVDVDPDDLTRAILDLIDLYPEVSGVTVLGGEPFDQPVALRAALAPLRRTKLNVMIYSGRTVEQLRRDPACRALLDVCDLLVDGPFRPDLYDSHMRWRGSSNQRLLRLSDAVSEADLAAAIVNQQWASAMSSDGSGAVTVSGQQHPRTRSLVASPPRGGPSERPANHNAPRPAGTGPGHPHPGDGAPG